MMYECKTETTRVDEGHPLKVKLTVSQNLNFLKINILSINIIKNVL